MSSSAYQQGPRLDESGVRSEIVEESWLDDKTTTPYRRGTVRLRVAAARPSAALQPGAAQPRVIVSRVRHATTMKLAPIQRPSRPNMTPDQLSHAALETFWKQQDRSGARKAKWLWLSAAVGAALLCYAMLQVSAPDSLWQGQRAPEVDLADLLMRSHAPARSSVQQTAPKTSKVMVTASERDELATLRVDSQPRARVFVDGLLIGNTPQLNIRVQPGVHQLRLYHPERDLLKEITLEVQPGETLHRIEQLAR